MPLPLATYACTLAPGEVRLPLEIQYRILGYLLGNRKILSACSVVCKAWLPICRQLLFNQIVLRPDFARFLRGSSQGSASISRHIRKVIFSGIIKWPCTVHVNFSVLDLPNIQEIYIYRSSFRHPDHSTSLTSSVNPPSGFLSITRIEMKSIKFASFALFAHFMGKFSNLKILKLQDISWEQLYCESSESYGRGPDLKPLSIQFLGLEFCDDCRVILNWLRHGIISEDLFDGITKRRRPLDFLSCLSFPDVLPREASSVISLAETIGDSLESLELGFTLHKVDYVLTDAIQKAVELFSRLHIKSFTLSQINVFQFPMLSPPVLPSTPSNSSASSTTYSPYAWIPSLLEAALSNKVAHLTMKVWLSTEVQMDLLDWGLIDKIISASELSTLRFQISGIGRDFSLVEAWFKSRLALVTASPVVIEFDFCHDLHRDRL